MNKMQRGVKIMKEAESFNSKRLITSAALIMMFGGCATIKISNNELIDYYHSCGESTTYTVSANNDCIANFDSTKLCNSQIFDSASKAAIATNKTVTSYAIMPGTRLIFQKSDNQYAQIPVDMNTQLVLNPNEINETKMYLAQSANLIGTTVYGYRSRILGLRKSVRLDSASSIGIYAEQPFNRFPKFLPAKLGISDSDISGLMTAIASADSIQLKFFNPICGDDVACKYSSHIYASRNHGLVFNISDTATRSAIANVFREKAPYFAQSDAKCIIPNRLIGALIFFPENSHSKILFEDNRNSIRIGEKYGITRESISARLFSIVANGTRQPTFIVRNP